MKTKLKLCKRCNGLGRIVEELDHLGIPIKETCYTCNGTGKILVLKIKVASDINKEKIRKIDNKINKILDKKYQIELS